MLDGEPDVAGAIGDAELLGSVTDVEITRSERIDIPDDIDMYSFDATKGDVVRVETRLPEGGAACDTFLRIFDAFGRQIRFDDDGNGTLSPRYSRIDPFVVPASGRYFVGISSYANTRYSAVDGADARDGQSVGDYTLAMILAGPRTALPPDAPTERVSSKLSDAKLNAVEAAADTVFRVGIRTSGALVGDTIELLINGDRFPTPKTVTLAADDIANGFVEFTVNGADLGGDGAKSLSALIADEAGLVGTASDSLEFEKDTVGPTVEISSDRDRLGAGETATVTFAISEFSPHRADNQITVGGGTLYALSGSGLAYTGMFTPAIGSTVPGSISVAVGGFTDAAGNPSLVASLASAITIDTVDGATDVGPTISTATLLGTVADVEITRTDRLATLTDVDMYAFDATQGDVLAIETLFPAGGEKCDTYLRIFDESGRQILVDDDSIIDSDYAVIAGFVVPATGRYYVGVSLSGNDAYSPNGGAGMRDGFAAGDYLLAVERIEQRGDGSAVGTEAVGQRTTIDMIEGDGPVTISVIALSFTYDQPVTVEGTPAWQLVIGQEIVSAEFTGISDGGKTLEFVYKITGGESGTVEVASQLSLNGASITDANGAPASLQAKEKPTVEPFVDSFSPAPGALKYPDSGVYRSGDRLDFVVEFNERITVTGTPRLQLTVGSQIRFADFLRVLGGKQANQAIFSYVADLTDRTGIAVRGPAIELNGATIEDRSGNKRPGESLPELFSGLGLTIPKVDSKAVRIDVDPPAAPSVPTEQGSTKLADGTLNAAEASTPTVFRVGLGESGALVGDTIKLLINGDQFPTPKTVTLSADDIANGSVEFTVNGADLGGDGAKSLSGRVIDDAGNQGAAGPELRFTKDSVGPGLPVIVSVVDDMAPGTGEVPNGGRTNDTSLLLNGTAESGSLIEIFDANTKLGDATVAGTRWSFTAAGLVDGRAYAFRARASDTAGNIGGFTVSRAVTVDTIPPGHPAVPAEQGSTKLADGLLNAAEASAPPVFRVGLGASGALVGDTIELLINGDRFPTPKTVTLAAGEIANGFVDFTINGADLGDDGAKALAARVVDASGNVGAVGDPISFVRDTIAPTVVVTSESTSLGVGQTALVTFDFSEPPAAFSIGQVDGAGGTLGPLTAETPTRYTAVFSPSVAVGTITVATARVADAAGNPNQQSNTVQIAYDNGGPRAARVGVPKPGVYGASKRLVFTVAFGVPVKVSGGASPALVVQVGEGSRLATWDGKAGSRTFAKTLSFAFTTTPGDSSPGGLKIEPAIRNGDFIRDKQGRSFIASLPTADATRVVVDAVQPAIVALGATPVGPFFKGQTIQLAVTFNKPVRPVGAATVRFTIPGFGAGTFGRPSGAGTTTLTFSYRFKQPASGMLQLASAVAGSVRDTAGNLVRNPFVPSA